VNYWKKTDERRIGIVAECEIVGIVAVGSYPPAVLIRSLRAENGLHYSYYFTLKAAAALQWQLALWIQEQAGKLLNG
jgi:hypothetical protein